MFPPSRRTLGVLCIIGFTLAAAGWFQALKQEGPSTTAGDVSARNGASSTKAGARRTGSADAKIMSDPRSIRLVELMEEMDQSAEAGQPNPAFIKATELTLNDSLFQRRQRDFRMLMEKMRPEDAEAIHRHFKALEREGRYFGPEYGAFAMRWGQLDGESALANWADRPPHEKSVHDLSNFVTGWATEDAEEALGWIEGNKELLGDVNAYPHLLAGWLVKDPVAATAWLTNGKLDPRQYRQCVQAGVLDKIYSDGLDGASEWLASLPDNSEELSTASKVGWATHIAHLGNLDPDLAATTWSKVGSQPWMGPEDFQRFCGSVAGGNQGSLESFAEQLSKSWPEAEASAQFSRWTEQNPAAVGALLSQLPPSGVRQAGIEGMLQVLERSDPGLAETWREQLGR